MSLSHLQQGPMAGLGALVMGLLVGPDFVYGYIWIPIVGAHGLDLSQDQSSYKVGV